MLLEDLEVVLKVAEFRSITAAATNLDMRTATASAAVKRVEASLGIELFVRTTRSLRLSNAGEKYLPQCEQAMLMLRQARQGLKDDLDIIDGELRVAMPSDLGRNLLTPWLDEFMDAYPKLSLSTHVSDSNIDFFRDRIDIALRYGYPSDANLYGFKICNVPGILCATPDYLEQHGTPTHPHELASHNGLFYQLHDVIHNIWTFSKDEQSYKIKMSGNRASNDADLVRRWAVAGKGLAVKSCLDLSSDLLNNRLVSVMPEYSPRVTELWLICPTRQSITPAVRLLRDRMREKCSHVLQQLIDKGVLEETVLD
jgi:DNA-binding transcriptional LysR family regulator